MNGFAMFDRDTATGLLTQKAGLAGCFTMDGRSLPGDATTDGQCTVARPFNNAVDIAVSPDGKSLYATTQADHGLVVFDRDLATGALTQKAGVAGCFTIDGRSVSGDPATAGQCTTTPGLGHPSRVLVLNNHVYVSHSPGVSASRRVVISLFDRDPATGALTKRAGQQGCIAQDGEVGGCNVAKAMNGIVGLKLDDGGERMYVSAFLTKSIAILDRNTTRAS